MRISLFGVPLYYGANRRGVDLGPAAILAAGIREKLSALGHTVGPCVMLPVPDLEPDMVADARLCYAEPIIAVANDLAERVREQVRGGALPIILGGDHSIALGSVSGVAQARGPIGVIWVDAHGDFNTAETSPSGHVHGMALAALCGLGDPSLVGMAGGGPHVVPRRVVLVGVRELDAGERRLMREAGVHLRTMADIDRRGMDDVITEAIALAGQDTQGIHVSVDLDVVEPREAPGVGTPVRGGLTVREAHLAMELIAASERLLGLDVVEVNPLLDHRNQTAELATELVLSALGKTII